MAQLGRVALGDLAATTNVNNNTSKDIQASNIRDQYENERDSVINTIDDRVSPKNVGGKNMLTYTNPPTLVELTGDDLPTRTNVEELIVLVDNNPNFKNVPSNTYIIENKDNGKVLYHDLASSDFSIPLNSTVEMFTVNTKDISTTTVSFDAGVDLVDYKGDSLLSWVSTLANKVAVFSRVSLNSYKVVELKEPVLETIPLAFSVSSDAPVSEDLTFNEIITIDTSSLVLHYSLLSTSFQTSIDGINYVTSADLPALQIAINNIGGGVVYTIRAVSVYNALSIGSATVGFNFN